MVRIEESDNLHWIVAKFLDALKEKNVLTDSDIKNIIEAGKLASH